MWVRLVFEIEWDIRQRSVQFDITLFLKWRGYNCRFYIWLRSPRVGCSQLLVFDHDQLFSHSHVWKKWSKCGKNIGQLKQQKNWSSSSFSEEQQCGLIKALVTLEESKHLLTGEQRKKSPITKEPLNREMDPWLL